jgi:sortase A
VRLSRINTLLVYVIILVNAYVVLTPFAPAVAFWVMHHATNQTQSLNTTIHGPALAPSDSIYAHQNRIVIPSILLDEPINEGKDMSALRKGLWRRPNTSTPDKGGNTVIAGHRFTYTNPRGTFYELNKVQVGDEIGVFWHGKRYLYKVRSVNQVKADDIAVEANTSTPQLTLYTCTPLWLPKDRLVVVADLENQP